MPKEATNYRGITFLPINLNPALTSVYGVQPHVDIQAFLVQNFLGDNAGMLTHTIRDQACIDITKAYHPDLNISVDFPPGCEPGHVTFYGLAKGYKAEIQFTDTTVPSIWIDESNMPDNIHYMCVAALEAAAIPKDMILKVQQGDKLAIIHGHIGFDLNEDYSNVGVAQVVCDEHGHLIYTPYQPARLPDPHTRGKKIQDIIEESSQVLFLAQSAPQA